MQTRVVTYCLLRFVYSVHTNGEHSHVAMPIEGLDSREQLVVVPDVDKHLCVVLHALESHRGGGGRGADSGRRMVGLRRAKSHFKASQVLCTAIYYTINKALLLSLAL